MQHETTQPMRVLIEAELECVLGGQTALVRDAAVVPVQPRPNPNPTRPYEFERAP